MKILDIINESQNFDFKNKDLIKKSGVVFTKSKTCKFIIENIKPDIKDNICEPSVGKGVFIFNLLEYFRKKHTIEELIFFVENNLFCYELDNEIFNQFKLLLNNYFKILGVNKLNLKNIKNEDFLFSNNFYDIIIGNPPYIRIQNLNSDYILKLKKKFKTINSGNIDLYYVFIEKSLKCSKKTSFIVPNSFLKNKSGKILRNIMNEKLTYIKDNGSKKCWENIGTYTCIFFTEEQNKSYFNYDFNGKIKKINKNEEWFGETKNILKDFFDSCSVGIATLRDNVYKFKINDEKFCYKDNIKIEKEICKKVLKATTNEEFWFIYPYNINNKILNEKEIKEKFPLTYNYLLSMKKELNKREKGNNDKLKKYPSWYAYGRNQGLLKNIKSEQCVIVLPITFIKENGIYYWEFENDVLVLSGIKVILNKSDKSKFLKHIKSNSFLSYLENNNKILPDKKNKTWLTLNTTTLKKY